MTDNLETERTRGPFAMIPDWVLLNPTILDPPSNLAVYTAMALMVNYKNRIGDADWEEINRITGLSRTVIYRCTKALKEAGIIFPMDGGVWSMPMDNPRDSSSQSRDSGLAESQSRDCKSQSRDSSVPIAGLVPLYTEGSELSSEVTRETAHTTAPAVFSRIWKTYPRKLNKQDALTAFLTRVKQGASLSDLERAASNYAASVVGVEQRHIMYGGTFFGPRDRWHDYLERPLPEQHAPSRASMNGSVGNELLWKQAQEDWDATH